jgi:hypothetical protein
MKKFAALVAVLALICFAAPAFAANPFMDVPMNHWAYDAVSQLASRGVVSGYPDGAFKGEWKATRYEMASVVARALAYVDMNKASKQDLELLKKLVVEFKDELDALGVKVDELDSRVALLEEGVGGWKFWGEFRFDAKWADNSWPPVMEDLILDGPDPISIGLPLNAYTTTGDTDFTVSRYRIWMSKKVDDKVTFIARLGGADATFERYYLDVKLPWDATMWVGKWNFDWEGDSGLYIDNDAWFTDQTLQGFFLSKNFASGNFDLFVAHEESSLPTAISDTEDLEDYLLSGALADINLDGYWFGARLNYNFNEKFRMAGNALWRTFDEPLLDEIPEDLGSIDTMSVYWVDAGVKFTPDIELKMAYFWQKYSGLNLWDITNLEVGYSDAIDVLLDEMGLVSHDPNAWKVILDVKQEAFGFTSLWLEYAHFDKHFFTMNAPYDDYTNGWLWGTLTPGLTSFGLPIAGGVPALSPGLWGGLPSDADSIMVHLNQKWNDKWETFQRYVKFDVDPIYFRYTEGMNGTSFEVDGSVDYDAQEWNVGVRYWYTSSLSFELSYSNYQLKGSAAFTGSDNEGSFEGSGSATVEDHMIRLRTYVSF